MFRESCFAALEGEGSGDTALVWEALQKPGVSVQKLTQQRTVSGHFYCLLQKHHLDGSGREAKRQTKWPVPIQNRTASKQRRGNGRGDHSRSQDKHGDLGEQADSLRAERGGWALQNNNTREDRQRGGPQTVLHAECPKVFHHHFHEKQRAKILNGHILQMKRGNNF